MNFKNKSAHSGIRLWDRTLQPENAAKETPVPYHNQSVPAIKKYFRFIKQHFELADLRMMSFESIHNLNLLATLAVGYIGLTTAIHKDNIFLTEIKECSKRIYKMSQFIFYIIGYTLKRVLSMCRSGINSLMPPKVRSRQITLFEYFKIDDCGIFGL